MTSPAGRSPGRACGQLLVTLVRDVFELGVDHAFVRSVPASGVAPSGSPWAALYMASPSFIEACIKVWVLALIASTFSPSASPLEVAQAPSRWPTSHPPPTLSPCSDIAFSVE